MGQPYVGEIRIFAGNFAPAGWAFCDGQPMPISEYETLFNLIGTTYGGDGQETFARPNLQSRFPIHMGTASSGTTYQIGETGGVEQVTLTTQQIPAHGHPIIASTANGNTNSPAGATWATASGVNLYIPMSDDPEAIPLTATAITATGGNQPHDNLQPYLVLSFILSLYGVYPSQS